MLRKPKISVIIPTHNAAAFIEDCLASIFTQTFPPFEVIVVDNASIDETPTLIAQKFPKAKVIRLKKNTGVTGGRNTGIKKTRGEFLFFFDHDMVAEPDMISELVKVAKSNPKIGIVTPKIYYWEDKKRIWAAGTGINLWTGQIVFRGGKDAGQYDKIEEVQVAPAAIFVKRKILDKIGGFDDVYFATYEDTDFCFRAKEAGFKIVYAPKAVAYHKIPGDYKSSMERLLSRAYFIGRNRIIFMKRYGKNFLVFLLFLPVFAVYYAFLALRFQKLGDFLDFCRGTTEGLILVVRRKV